MISANTISARTAQSVRDRRTRRLIIYGDSVLRGITYSPDRQMHLLCRGYRLERLAALGFAVENRSRMGATVERGLNRMESDAAAGADFLSPASEDEKRPLMLLEYGGNDCDFHWRAIADDPLGEHHPRTSEARFREAYRRMIDLARSLGFEVLLSAVIPMDAERFLHTVACGREREILRWLGDVARIARYQEYYSRLVEQIARASACPYLDTRTPLLFAPNFGDLLSADGIHPTDEGHDFIEEILCEKLKNFL